MAELIADNKLEQENHVKNVILLTIFLRKYFYLKNMPLFASYTIGKNKLKPYLINLVDN